MINTNETRFSQDPSGKKLIVIREFNAPVEKVWRAWTESSLLDQWWAPKPWKAETKSMAFKEGGRWLYYMLGPAGDRHWCKVEFQTIDPHKSFTVINSFCDENGNTNGDLPVMHWSNNFASNGAGTTITVEISFDSTADLQKIVEMGFKEGFKMGLGNLDEMIAMGQL